MRTTNEVLYKKIEDYIMDYISQRNLRKGDRLPPERHIGDHFGVSQCTVRMATKSFIKKGVLARQHGKGMFVRQDSSLMKVSTGKIGVISCYKGVGLFSFPSNKDLFSIMQGRASEIDKSLVFKCCGRDKTADMGVIEELGREVDGFVVFGLLPEMQDRVIAAIRSTGKPVVFLCVEGLPGDVNSVVGDMEAGTRDITQHVIDAGHTRIAFLYAITFLSEKITPRTWQKIRSFKNTLDDNGFESRHAFIAGIVTHDDPEKNPSFTDFRKMMESKNPPTAIICSNDITALSVYRMAERLNLSIPDDLSVTGMYNYPDSQAFNPPLTTIDDHRIDLGIQVIDRLEQLHAEYIKGSGTKPFRMVLPVTVVKRNSVKNL